MVVGMEQVPDVLADVIHSHSGTKVFIEQEVPAFTRVVTAQREHARLDLVFNLNGSGCFHCCSFLLQPVSCYCSQHLSRTHGQES